MEKLIPLFLFFTSNLLVADPNKLVDYDKITIDFKNKVVLIEGEVPTSGWKIYTKVDNDSVLIYGDAPEIGAAIITYYKLKFDFNKLKHKTFVIVGKTRKISVTH